MQRSVSESAWIERWAPIVWPIPLTIACFYGLKEYGVPEQMSDLFGAALNISTMGVGFLATAKAILFSLGDTNRLRNIKKQGYFDRLVGFLLQAIQACALLAILSVSCLIFRCFNIPFQKGLLLAWMFVAFLSAFLLARVVSVLTLVLRHKDAVLE